MKFSTATRSDSVLIVFQAKSVPMFEEKDGVRHLIMPIDEGKDVVPRRALRSAVKCAVRTAKQHRIARITFDINAMLKAAPWATIPRAEAIEDIATNILLAQYDFSRYKTDKRKEQYVEEVALLGLKSSEAEAIKHAEVVGTVMNGVRDLSNTPGGDMTPDTLAKSITILAKGSGTKVTALNKRAIEREGMGALLGVARGSAAEPRFIILEYYGGKKTEAPVVFVGKGITFDTGGLNIKPSDAVLDMHLDMSGGAAVAGAVIAAARLKIKKNIIGLIPAAENMVSGESFRPGDVLTSLSGKTIDVLNTDAEGRLVLADALTYAKRYKPRLVIDVATLTGAALVALGQHASAVMTQKPEIAEMLLRLGEETGDYVWQLPLWHEYKQYTKGVFADVANIPSSHGRYAGSINGGMFLSHFAEGYPWAHIDMAPRMTAAPGDHLAKGSTGEPMRLLLAVAEEY